MLGVQDLDLVVGYLRKGEVVALPTETVYGLAAHALDPQACAKIFDMKGRPWIDPLIVHVADEQAAQPLCHWNERAALLAKAFWPGPLTLVLPKKPCVPDVVTAARPSVALRCPAHPFFSQVLKASGLPLAAPSANAFGCLSPTQAHHVVASLQGRVRYVVDGGACDWGLESTIVDLTQDPRDVVLMRPGPISQDELQVALGPAYPVRTYTHSLVKEVRALFHGLRSPGLLDQHYCTHTRLELFGRDCKPEALVEQLKDLPGPVALVFLARPNLASVPDSIHLYWLSQMGILIEVARHLFDLLHRLDTQGYRSLHVQLAPEAGIGVAINNRLRRSAAKFSKPS